MNGTMIQYFEWELADDGKHWQRASQDAKHLANKGFSHIWLPPATKGTGTNDVGYGIYDLYDLGEFDQKGAKRTKYGTKDDYLQAIQSLQEAGLSVLGDVVLNHKAGADESERFEAYEVNPDNRQEIISDAHEIEGWTKFTFPGRGDTYSDFKWNWTHFSGVDYDQATDSNGIFMIKGLNKGWADNDDVDNENGNFDYLMFADIDYRHPDVVKEVENWAQWYVQETGLNGFRLDALKHINADFIEELADKLLEADPDFYLIGEYWKGDYASLENYMNETSFDIDLFDVKLHQNFKEASELVDGFDMSTLLDDTLLQKNPTLAIPFVDNHDSQPGQSLESWVQDWFKPLAYALILLHQDGLPCVFYGDYYGISGDNPIPGKQELLDQLLDLRQKQAYGKQNNYFDHPNCVGFSREGDDDHPDGLALLMSNGEAGYKDMYVGQAHAGQEWQDALGNSPDTVTINDDGYGHFTCPAGNLSVWVRV
ncbi:MULTISPECIES: alpha-amylase [Aerococcus]|uniref:Alpha-amylase n=1 Tax=Aerococcus sanguinicola TaxID=119206 RepID=A0A5N1GR96_9LACT|nr:MULTISPECIES: alpha-amylase [Aerococcus]KAA9301220.1 alpha-amylase [Aerococcus sanguinicola]MDK6369244.1 alpha-amylase [Aerococcus sp. UMB9870]MDK6679067.1 alpha-amylase [Aerococcus sp. UMB8608]MDK6686975.1 alpha-amylase [Aerococcus sp. UMB8623]MDK6940130.1 alpha-amylase [Aerococcus sp. UMB8487]